MAVGNHILFPADCDKPPSFHIIPSRQIPSSFLSGPIKSGLGIPFTSVRLPFQRFQPHSLRLLSLSPGTGEEALQKEEREDEGSGGGALTVLGFERGLRGLVQPRHPLQTQMGSSYPISMRPVSKRMGFLAAEWSTREKESDSWVFG